MKEYKTELIQSSSTCDKCACSTPALLLPVKGLNDCECGINIGNGPSSMALFEQLNTLAEFLNVDQIAEKDKAKIDNSDLLEIQGLYQNVLKMKSCLSSNVIKVNWMKDMYND